MNRVVSKAWLLFLMLPFLQSCHVARYFYWNVANIDDYQKFDNDTIKTDNFEPVFHYEPKKLTTPEQYTESGRVSLDEFLQNNNTVAFALIADDTVLKENYYNKYSDSSYVTSFSVAKSFVSALTGIAVEDGAINTIDDPITDYLTYLDKNPFEEITIRDLLHMRSGLEANEGYYNPLGDVAKYYYGTNLKKYLAQIKRKSPPDEYFEYLSVNTQLLAAVVETATGRPIQDYLQEKIWKPLNMESYGLWSLDSEKRSTVKAFCCLSARAMDFARFGRLYLNNGEWKGRHIVPESWIKQTLDYPEDNIDWQDYPYSFQWRVTRYGAYFAKGIKGQYIYIYPEKNIVAVRFGTSYADIDWAAFFKSLIDENFD